MDLGEARKVAVEMLCDSGLTSKGWTFYFDNATGRAGQTNFYEKSITLTCLGTKIASEDDVRQTMLHEIAHALVGCGHAHDSVWLETARSIGYRQDRTMSLDTEAQRAYTQAIADASKWEGRCAISRKVLTRAQRLGKRKRRLICKCHRTELDWTARW